MMPFFACTWCKDLINKGLAEGYFWTILLLLAVPILLVGTITFLLVRASKRLKQRKPNAS